MARPIPQLEDLTKISEEIKPKETKSFIDVTVDTIRNNSTKNLVLGTFTDKPRPLSEEPKPAVIQRPEPYKPEEPFEKPFLPSKPIPHPPKITPSSIPNPNPSVTANMEAGYPNYTGFLYNIPGYSAFQPVNYSNNHPPPPTPMQTETPKPDFKPFTITGSREVKEQEDKFEKREETIFGRKEENEEMETNEIDTQKPQDFEDNFTMQIIPPTSKTDTHKNSLVEPKMSMTSIAHGSGGSATMPTSMNKEIKKKSERYSLKTSIPISKIDMKCVSSPVDTAFQNAIKNPVFNPVFQKETERPKLEIQSNIVIKTATTIKDPEVKDKPLSPDQESLRHNSINTLLNAAEAINKNDSQFRVPEPKADDPKETKDPLVATQPLPKRSIFLSKEAPPVAPQSSGLLRPMPNPVGSEVSKTNSAQPSANQRSAFNLVSADLNKTNQVQTAANQRPMFNPGSTGLNKTNPNQPSTKTNSTQSSVNQRPMFNPGSTDSNKMNQVQTSANQRPMLTGSSDSNKTNQVQSLANQRSMFNAVSGEASNTNSTTPLANQRPMFNPMNIDSSQINQVQTSANQRTLFNSASAEASKANSAQPAAIPRPMFNPVTSESNKPNFPSKPPEGGYNEQKNVVFLQNQKQNPKMLLTIQPNPQVILQRTNFESKNLQAPSRLSSQSKKNEAAADTSSKVVALKRLHQDNCDENDFENLITENQIYGNKIVVKEKSPTTQEEWKSKVKVDKQTDQDWKSQLKIDIKVDKPPENKNIIIQPNFVYLSNVQFPANLMMVKNNSKICQTTDSTKMKVSPNENRATDVNMVNNNNIETNNTAKNPKPLSVVINKEVHVLKSSNNVLQTLSNNNNKTDAVIQTNQKVIVTPQVVYQVPIVVTEADIKNQVIEESKVTIAHKKEPSKLLETKPDKVLITCQVDAKVPKILIATLRSKTKVVEEVSILDIYEQKKRLRRLKYLSHSNKDVPKTDPSPTTKKIVSKPAINVITSAKIKTEIFKEFLKMKGKREDESSDSESDSEDDELDQYNEIIEKFGANYNRNAKEDFLAMFSLATREVLREKQLERHERTLKCDAIASAYIAAGRLEDHMEEPSPSPEPECSRTPEPQDKSTVQRKQQFLSQFKLMRVSPVYKADYEKSWREIVRERNRRYGIPNPEPFDPDGQLQMLTEINKSVNENNALIKKRLDSIGDENSDIRILAEKNFSELNRLSKMADRSVKLFSGKDTKKRDLNPGFDSENIKKFKIDDKAYPKLNIPNISKIVTLKTDQESGLMSSSKATSMDEPLNSASCGEVMTKEVGCQAEGEVPWERVTDVMDDFIKKYRKYEIARKKEMDEIQRNNTRLRVESAHITRSASRDSDRAHALLAERQLLAGEEARLRTSLEKLNRAIEAIKKL